MKKDKDIINYDNQGWPIYKMSIRDILKQIVEPKDGKFIIDENDERLDVYPLVLRDDGMGYGVDEKRIFEFNIFKDQDKYRCNVFVEEEIENIELWNNSRFYPYACVKLKKRKNKPNETYMLTGINQSEDGEFSYNVRHFKTVRNKTIEIDTPILKDSEIEYD